MPARTALLALLLPVLASACGSSGSSASNASSTTTTRKAETMAQFVRTANAVCIKSDRRISKIGDLNTNPKGWTRTVAAARLALREMRKVTPPPQVADAFERMLSFGDQLAGALQRIHDRLVVKNYDGARQNYDAAAKLSNHVHAEAKAAGLTFCQQPTAKWPA